ncbi:TadE family protein [Intrasporangium sp.]|uniref:TadE family protein n=1 Tax=Intrasporangium sp. TaxID=1925024 RepID=UPI0032218962
MTNPLRACPRRATRLVRDRESGSAAIQLAIIAPAVLVLILLAIAAGRISRAATTVDQAAYAAARAASIARTPGQARTDAAHAAAAALGRQGTTCSGGASTHLDLTGFHAPAGTPAQVTARITCQVALADLAIPGLGGSRTIDATAVSALDTYRERTTP